MGLFFSSITRNQIIAAVFTFVGMTLFLLTFFLNQSQMFEGTVWGDVLYYGSFIDLWYSSLQGLLAPRYLVFHFSVAIFFLFLTDKVLEAAEVELIGSRAPAGMPQPGIRSVPATVGLT